MEPGFVHPSRGREGDYERYLRGMDSSMRQKVALTAAHLLGRGRVADMGMGSGAGSAALAALYPELDVVGVDVDPQMVARARARHVLGNLSFVTGDIATAVFADGSLDGIFDSSVLHHVTSFGGYDRGAAARALAVQARALAPHGVLVVRDFVDPGPGEVLLDVPDDDGTPAGQAGSQPTDESTAARLERCAREFRSLAPTPGFPLTHVAGGAGGGAGTGAGTGAADGGPALRSGWRRYRLSATHAAEFLLRKDYRADWAAEIQEEYTYFTQAEFEACFEDLGLRLLASTPLWNPWIVRRRFEGHCALWGLDGRPREFPATNTIVVGERVGPDDGVRLLEVGPAGPPTFLAMSHCRDRQSGRSYDLVRRPGLTVDVVPWFAAGQSLFVIARRSFPRPILAAARDRALPLDGGRAATWVTEPISAIQTDAPLGETVETTLAERGAIPASAIRAIRPGATYYPSPGGIQEEVRSVLVEVDPVLVGGEVGHATGLSSAGRVRAIDAGQVLRAAQVGGLPDARLEINTYELFLRHRRDPGPWLGDAIDVGPDAHAGVGPRDGEAPDALWSRPRRRRYEACSASDSPGFLDLRCATFRELAHDGRTVAEVTREYVVPRQLSARTVAVAVLARGHDGRIYLGVDDDDLPAAQALSGGSELLVAPAWRLPMALRTPTEASDFVRQRLHADYGVTVGPLRALGGRYHPSPGLTPEVVTPSFAVVMDMDGRATRGLHWLSVADAVAHRAELLDGHLRIVALRLAHGLGLLAATPAEAT